MTVSRQKSQIHTDRNSDELASVVIADQAADDARAWWVRLLPWAICLCLLLVVEGAARVVFDYTLAIRHQRFDNFPSPATQESVVSAIRRDRALRVVMLGDSTVVGSSLLLPNQSIPRQLELALNKELPGVPIHVWDLSMVGSRAVDLLCMLKKVEEARPDAIVVQGNYFLCLQVVDKMTLFHPWLADTLREVPDSVKPYVPARTAKEEMDERITRFFESHVRLVGMRQAINTMLFGVQGRTDIFSHPNPLAMAATSLGKRTGLMRLQSWRERQNGNPFFDLYTNPIQPHGANLRFYPNVAAELGRSGAVGVTYQTPQNPAIVAASIRWEAFLAGRRLLTEALSAPGVTHHDYSELVPEQYFVDATHMLPDGNRILAQRLARDLAPLLRSRMREPSAR
jgi:hypothetical protein